ncbi:MAG: amidohydrolase [Alphaproteobacteria bacterium]|nr:amidohydrolase [Alphaproteobacteria bacterium]
MSDLPRNITPALAETMIKARRAIHENPELSHEERETSALVRRMLESAGISEIEPVFDTGLVATIRGKGNGRTLALRADMDALPIEERRPDLPFHSKKAGVMHACGHDVHTSVLLGVALALQAERDKFSGTVRCVFQPAEEAEPLGAREIIKAGHMKGVEGIVSLHVDPEIPVGLIGVRAGALMAGGQEFTIRVKGRSSHAARPHLGIDALAAACAIVGELQKVRSRRTDPLEPVVVTIGRMQAGTAKNIIAETAVIEGTFRVLDEGLRSEVARLIESIAQNVARANGAEASFETLEGEPVLVNDAPLTDLVRRAASDILGAERVTEMRRPSMGSEDFAYYARVVPGTMFRLGIRNEEAGMVHPLHHPEFAVDERAIPVGASVMLAAARRFLDGER